MLLPFSEAGEGALFNLLVVVVGARRIAEAAHGGFEHGLHVVHILQHDLLPGLHQFQQSLVGQLIDAFHVRAVLFEQLLLLVRREVGPTGHGSVGQVEYHILVRLEHAQGALVLAILKASIGMHHQVVVGDAGLHLSQGFLVEPELYGVMVGAADGEICGNALCQSRHHVGSRLSGHVASRERLVAMLHGDGPIRFLPHLG